MARPGRLSAFQRLARTWDAVHPYNAGQTFRIRGVYSPADIGSAWSESLGALGLGSARASKLGFGFRPAAALRMNVLAPEHDLSRLFTDELNRPFEDPNEAPFRAFVQITEDDTTRLGVVYQHWVADSFSIRLLLREWIMRLLEPSARTTLPLKLARSNWLADEILSPSKVWSLFRQHAAFRRVRKAHTFGRLNYRVRVRMLGTLPGIVPGLLRYARSKRVKVNDVFLASLAQLCNQFIPAQFRPHRNHLAVSAVTDLRRALPPGAARSAFGCLLGFTSVVCKPSDAVEWENLLRRIAAQNPARHPGESDGGALWMLAAEIGTLFTPPHRIYGFYRKETPFAAGVSNVNLAGTWFAERHPSQILDYARVSPTGPMVPLAMNVTTLGDDLHLSMTYRAALLNDWTAAELAQGFVRRITGLASGSV